MRVKLGLSDKEIMNRPWILTQIESADIPWYNPKKKKVLKGKQAIDALSKLMK